MQVSLRRSTLSPQARARLARRSLPIALAAAALGVLAPRSQAQVLFSVDYRGPTIGTVGPCPAPPITAGDILSVTVPGLCAWDGPMYGPMPGPETVIGGGPGGLGLLTVPGCAGGPPGGLCPAEVDAFSRGFDPILTPGMRLAGEFVFSVDEWAIGSPLPLVPSVGTEAPVADSAADVFEALYIPALPPPFPPVFTGINGNTGLIDGNGMASPTTAHYPGTGLFEPRPPVPGPGPRPGDNLDALDIDAGPAVAGFNYFSLDGGIFDPLYGVPGLGTAAANGFLPGMVLASAGGPPGVYAPPLMLGLDLLGPGTDDLDALALFENGIAGFQPSPGPFAWGPGGPDMLLFSVRRGSAVVGMIASGALAIPIEPGDILIPPAAIGLPPQILVPCEYLGLASARMGMAPIGDDLDALDTRRPPATGTGMCHGDGTLIPCPCLNNGANGNGCANSFNPAGANLTGTGIASVAADSVLLTATGMSGGICLFVQGSGVIPPALLDDGIWCIGGIIRLATNPVVGGTSTYPQGANLPVSVKGMVPAVGGIRYYQGWYRNAAPFCTPFTSNRTSGFQIVWAP